MRATRLAILLFAVALVAAACGGDDGGGDTTSPTTNEASGNGGGDDGSGGSSNGGGGFTNEDAGADAVGAGEDFPIAVPGGWEVDGLAVLEEQGASFSGGVQLYYASDDLDDLVAFYDEWTAAQPDEYARSESPEIVVYTKSSPLTQISINKDFEYQGESWTFLVISAASE